MIEIDQGGRIRKNLIRNVIVSEGERQKSSQQGCSSLQSQRQTSPTFSQGNLFLITFSLFFLQKNVMNLTLLLEIREVMRKLSPPPSERDYIFSLSQGETLPDLFEDDLI